MSKSFALINGDLVVTGGRTFQTVANRDKLAQDLRLWILQEYGLDPNTPQYGSQLDTYIGSISSQAVLGDIRSEVLRVLQQYQNLQIANMQSETIQNAGSTTLDPSEVISTIDNVTVQSIASMVLVTVSITTLDESQTTLSIPINANA